MGFSFQVVIQQHALLNYLHLHILMNMFFDTILPITREINVKE